MRLASLLAALLPMITLGGCTVSSPFAGPGYEAGTGVVAPGSEPVLVALTEAVVRRDGGRRAAFIRRVRAVEASLAGSPGLIGYSLRIELFAGKAWTMSVWADEESLRTFVASAPHRAAMADSDDVTESMAFARFRADRTEIPLSWGRALAILAREGYPYR